MNVQEKEKNNIIKIMDISEQVDDIYLKNVYLLMVGDKPLTWINLYRMLTADMTIDIEIFLHFVRKYFYMTDDYNKKNIVDVDWDNTSLFTTLRNIKNGEFSGDDEIIYLTVSQGFYQRLLIAIRLYLYVIVLSSANAFQLMK